MHSIRTKITNAFLLMVLTTSILVVVIVVINVALTNRYKDINENIFYEQELKENISFLVDDIYKGINRNDYNAYYDRVQKIKDMEKILDVKMAESSHSADTKIAYRSLKNSLTSFFAYIDTSREELKESGSIEGISSVFNESSIKLDFVLQNSTNLILSEFKNIANITQEIEKIQKITVVIISIVVILISILLITFAMLFSRKISDPLIELSLVARKISEGDLNLVLNQKMLDGNDEIGSLARSFSVMLKNLREKMQEIENGIQESTEKNRDLSNSKSAIMNLLEDIEDEKKKAEELVIIRTKELKDEKARLVASINSLSFGFMIADMDNNILLRNKTMNDLFNLSDKENLSMEHIYELFKGQVDIKQRIRMCLRDKNDCELKQIMSEGKIFRGIIAPIKTPESDTPIGYVFLLEDITEAYTIDHAKSEFVSLASHQLRTPLSAINWYSEMLMTGDAGELNPQQKEFIEEVSHSSKRMSDLVSTLLNVSRIELGSFNIDPKLQDLCTIVNEEVKDLEVIISSKQLRVNIACNLNPAMVFIDENLMSIVIQNLLTNAVKYTPVKGEIVISVDKDITDESIVVAVIDAGVGIEERDQKKIFTKMYRGDNARVLDADGNGLGLYMVKSILESSGCSIWFESPPKGYTNGTAFYVRIPKDGMKQKLTTRHLIGSKS